MQGQCQCCWPCKLQFWKGVDILTKEQELIEVLQVGVCNLLFLKSLRKVDVGVIAAIELKANI